MRLFLLYLLSVAVGANHEVPVDRDLAALFESRIIAGSQVTDNRYPWYVLPGPDLITNKIESNICGGGKSSIVLAESSFLILTLTV